MKVNKIFRSKVSLLEGYSRISSNPYGGFHFCHDLKLFQIKARRMSYTRDPGKFVWCSNFCSKVLVYDPEFLEKVNDPEIFLDFFGSAGGSAPGKVLRL